jgi:hypothetical protein
VLHQFLLEIGRERLLRADLEERLARYAARSGDQRPR